jgi:hypothetical protein
VSAFVYNSTAILVSGYILMPVIIIAVVGAAWLVGRAGERIGLFRGSRWSSSKERETE